MAKRGLVIGCNYPQSETPLLGSANDALAMKSMLEKVYGFKSEDITVLIDTDNAYKQPTSGNIKDTLKELVEVSEPGDAIFVHFSGHGVQLPAEDDEAEEVDGLDEAIVPSDMNPILDDDLRQIFKPLKERVALTVVADCCHSGGLLDHLEAPVEGGKWKYPEVPELTLGNFMSALGLKKGTKVIAVDSLGEKKLKYRTLPYQELLAAITPETKQKIRQTIYDKFGEKSSSKIQSYVKYGTGAVKVASRGIQKVRTQGCLATILGFLGIQRPSGEQRPEFYLPGQKPAKSQQLPDDVGVLITACQSDEKAADANVSGNKSKAGGALTKALITVVTDQKNKNPDKPLTNRALVMAIRNYLTTAGFAQNPGLEGSIKNAELEFVTGKEVQA